MTATESPATTLRRAAPDTEVGTLVLAWPGSRDVPPMLTHTRTPAWMLGSGHLVVSVEGYPGGIALSHVDVLPADLADRVYLGEAE